MAYMECREQYGSERDGWINRLYQGDNLLVMGQLLEEFRGKVDLIYVDPPFDSGADYKKKIQRKGRSGENGPSFAEKQYGDIWSGDEYLEFLRERLALLRELLADSGSIYLHCDWHKSHYLRLLLDEVFGPKNFRNEIIWGYRTGGVSKSTFARKHDTLFFYSKGAHHKFHVQYYRSYQEKRYNYNPRYPELWDEEKKRWYHNAVCRDVWEDIPVLGTEADVSERTAYPTQKPEALLERIVRASSDPGDLVLDCFMGSGTAPAAAMKLGRRFIGVDSNPAAVHTATKRLLAAVREPVAGEVYTGFAVYRPALNATSPKPAEADIILEDGRLIIRGFSPPELLEKMKRSGDESGDWRDLVESVMIDWSYDGAVLRPTVADIPGKKERVTGVYPIPEGAGPIRVKITDLLADSLEVDL